MDIEQKLIDLEMRLAYQDKTISELNQVVWQQQKKIDELGERVKTMQEKMADDPTHHATFNVDLDRPPHY